MHAAPIPLELQRLSSLYQNLTPSTPSGGTFKDKERKTMKLTHVFEAGIEV